MKKLLSFILLLSISSMMSFGQNLSTKPTTKVLINSDESQNHGKYFNKTDMPDSKASIWTSSMSTASSWVASYGSGSTINIPWTWISDTGAAAPLFKEYVYPNPPFMNGTTCTTGLFYIDANTPSFANPPLYGTYNSMLTNSVAINTNGHNAVALKFYQVYYAYNADTTIIEISNDNINWHMIDVNPGMAVNTRAYGWKTFNISAWAANKPQVWIRFRFGAPEYSGGSQVYGGGYGWMIDDIELYEPANNLIQVDRVTLHDGYTQVPTGLGVPMYYDADITNTGALAQPHTKLHAVVIGAGIDSTSNDTTLAPGGSLLYTNNLSTTGEYFIWNTDYFYTPPTTLGTYKVTSYISSDSIPKIALDTFDINVVCNTCNYSRDNNTYTDSRWFGATGTSSDPYTAVSVFEVNQNRMAYGVNCVVSQDSKVGSKIKAVLYKYFAATATRTIVAQSANYYITAANIPTATPMINPPSISLPFTSGYTMQADSSYWVGIQVYGGTDTVKIATDNTGIPQWEQTSLVFDPTGNVWYKWASGNVPALMIRTVFDPTIGINEVANNPITLFSCMPNPANNYTKISYELKNNENTSILITDITGRVVKSIHQGTQAKGNYAIDVDLSNLCSGTYFYTLKTATSQATDKLIIVKR
ncbi:MAG: T9SS type A sorting domain-containing protein [Bacteroidales bacterium]